MKIALALTFCLAAGVSMAQPKDPAVDCLLKLKDDDRFALINQKMPIDIIKGQSIEVLADGSRINPKEKAQLSTFVKEGQACYESGAEWRQKNYPLEGNSLMVTYNADVLAQMADLFAGKLTFGEMAKFRAKRLAEFQSAINTLVQQIKAKQEAKQEQQAAQEKATKDQERLLELRAWQEREMAQERFRREQELAYQQQQEYRRTAAMQFFLSQRPIFQPAPVYQMQVPQRPVITNCINNGASTNCTTN